MKITQLTLDDEIRQLAAMRSAMLKRTLSEYVTALVAADAGQAGLTDLLKEANAHAPVPATDSEVL